MDLDSLNDFGRKIFSEFHDQKEITNADCVFQQTFSFSSKESKWNPVFRLRKSYIEKIHDVKKNAGVGGQLFFFETICINSGQGFDQCSFPMVNMTAGTDHKFAGFRTGWIHLGKNEGKLTLKECL